MGQSNDFTKIQFASETSAYGTEGTSWTELARVQSSNLDSNNGNIYGRGLGEGANVVSANYGPFDGSGNVSFDVVDFTFLKHWVGFKGGSGSSSTPYYLKEATSVEAEAEADGNLTPFSIEILNDDGTDTADFAWGCVGTDFSLSGSIGSKLNCSANFVGQKTGHRATGQTYTPVTDSAFVMINGTWKWGSTPTAISGVREWSINYTNDLKTDTRSIESRFIGIPKLGQRGYTYSVGIIMASALANTVINNFYGYTSGGVYTPEDGSTSTSPTADLEFKIELVNGSNYANIHLDQCVIDRISKPAQLGGGLVILTFEGTAFYGKDKKPIQWWTV
jgi:hypothetical protein